MTVAGRVRDFPAGPFREAATAWLRASEHLAGPEPRPAATVLLLRGEPVEVFMIERAPTMAFAPSAWVFPGGRVDATDREMAGAGTSNAETRRDALRLGLSVAETSALQVAAVRELFEETGVLLASGVGQAPGAVDDAAWRERRRALEERRTTFAEILGDAEIRSDLLTAVDRWITPEFEQRRYDTVFFLAMLPTGCEARAVSRESRNGRWVRPQEALDDAAAGRILLLPPTRTRLESLCRSGDAAAHGRPPAVHPLSATRPQAVEGPEGVLLRAEVNP